jgi:hypoxanthine phosphoribosyltransferase
MRQRLPEIHRVDWPAYHRLIERLARQVHDSGYAFDSLIALSRGGLRVGDVFSRVFRVPLAVLATSAYRGAGPMEAGSLSIALSLSSTAGEPAGRVLVVDDLADSGTTLACVLQALPQRHPGITELRSAVLWLKARSALRPDYFVEYLAGDPWIEQPFEQYDHLRPQDLDA